MSNTHVLQIDIRGRAPDKVWIAIKGDVDERADFTPILALGVKGLVIDLSEVRRINSIGVRQWMQFVNTLSERGIEVVFERCSVPIVQQLNMIASFRGRGLVASVFAPYYCSKCDQDHRHLIELNGSVPDLEAKMTCPNCGGPLEFDDIAQTYLGFAGGS
jgi:anti-anti-sigma regulatory factor